MFYLMTIAVFVTSVISGVLSMAGGMILMAVFSLMLSVPAAMVLHGVAQTASNGSRIWLYRQHIRWQVLIPYSVGALMVLALFLFISYIPERGMILILIGLFPFIGLLMPRQVNLNIEKPLVALTCGILVTTAQMLAGASGPVLDLFYLKSNLTRHEVLGTKAITQTLGHIIKLGYYLLFLDLTTGTLPWWVFPAVVVAALTGNISAKLIVEKIDDTVFRKIGGMVILAIGASCIIKGTYDLFF